MSFKVKETTPTSYMTQYVNNVYGDKSVLKYLYGQVFSDFNPDVSGYVLVFMEPPDLSGYRNLNPQYNFLSRNSFVWNNTKRIPVVATTFTPPQIQMNTTAISGSAGSQKLPTELVTGESLSITYVETNYLDIYSFHQTWINYINEVIDGTLTPDISTYIGSNGEERKIDYAASFYLAKWSQNLQNITYLGKAIGCIPRELPSSEILGNRTSLELTNVGFTYDVFDYREETLYTNKWLRDEFEELIISRYI